MKRYSLKKPFLRIFFGQLVPHDLPLEENPEGEWVRWEDLPAEFNEPSGWIALKDALPEEGRMVQIVSDAIEWHWQVLAERTEEGFISHLSEAPINLANEKNIRWAYVILPPKPPRK